MDTVEATKMVMSRIQNLDPENASKIMGYILIQDHGEKEMIRLAFGPENLLVSVIKQAKAFLDISSNTLSAPSSFNHQKPPRIMVPNNGFYSGNPSSPNSPWCFQNPRSAVPNGGASAAKNVEFMDSIVSPGSLSDSMMFTNPNNSTNWGPHQHHLHRRSYSVNDAFIGGGGDDDTGDEFVGWKPCMYFEKGFCKNGSCCNFAHGGFGEEMGLRSPCGKFDGVEDFLRIKAIQQQRIAAMAQGRAPHFPFNRCMKFNENPRSAATAALMMGNPYSSSRQIYLTFPADSCFEEDDVCNYFSIFGPVQDVRIPHQHRRMFGFVTFVYPETVKAILAKGNPHFVCDSRVLVKPYKEKGKILEKKHQQLTERGDFYGCLSPTALENADPSDHVPFGARMFNHEMMLRRKFDEQVEVQNSIEFQDRRLMNLQLMDVKNHQHNNEEVVSGEISSSGTQVTVNSPTDGSAQKVQPEVNKDDDENNNRNVRGKEEIVNLDKTDDRESLEHILPDNLFSSPTKMAVSNHQSIFSTDMAESHDVSSAMATPAASSKNSQLLPATSAIINMASLKSCYFQMPRQEAIEM